MGDVLAAVPAKAPTCVFVEPMTESNPRIQLGKRFLRLAHSGDTETIVQAYATDHGHEPDATYRIDRLRLRDEPF